MGGIATLTDILDVARRRAAALRGHRRELEAAAAAAPLPPPWSAALSGHNVAVIAEVKRRSPSAGRIASALDPGALARAYAAGGAAAVSVLTEEPHFGGSLADLEEVRRAVSIPVLRKDFLLAPEQVYESRARGASAVLLIVRALDRDQFLELAALAAALGLGCLVEVHTSEELETALEARPECVGVNSRDLDTYAVDVEGALHLLSGIPREIVAIAESGLLHRADVERAAAHGADAVLVGTALSGAPDPEAAVRALGGISRQGRSR